jgi:formamidopyrimidine-DNA glycosylase
MPEGPEIASLCKRLKILGLDVETIGKHLLYKNSRNECFDISFGLVGKIKLIKSADGYDIEKITTSSLSGDIRQVPDFDSVIKNLGVDWLSSDRESLLKVVQSWSGRNKKIAALLIDQHDIAGIGVAWGSEILDFASIHPSTPATEVDIERLVDSIISIGEKAMEVYDNYDEEPEKFVDRWFINLYSVRRMESYKKGNTVMVSGRKFYTNQSSRVVD